MKVSTWADGFGRWHARVNGADPLDFSSAYEAAHAAIRRELDVRGADKDWVLRIHAVPHAFGAPKGTTTVVFREAVD